MEALTSCFPFNVRRDTRAPLDNIISYSGPPPAKSRETASTEGDERPDIDITFVKASQQEEVAVSELLNPTGDLNIVGEGEHGSQGF
jgi:hypothetical protein